MVLENSDSFHSAVFDAIPSPVVVVDEDVRIIDYNDATIPLLGAPAESPLHWRGGDAFRCMHSFESPDGCGRSPHCKECVIRNSVTASFQGQKVVRRATKMEFASDSGSTEGYLLVTTSPMDFNSQHYVLLVLEDVSEIMELRQVLPLCANCKKIRDDEAYWASVDEYFQKHWDVGFTYGLCPECLQKLQPELYGALRE